MAEDKKGFILYADQKEMFDQLPNEKAGELIKFIFSYVNDDDPETDDLLINLAFTPIKQQFKRDLEKWENKREQRSNAGKASAKKRANEKQRKATTVNEIQQASTNPTVSVNDNVTVNDNVSVTVNDNVKGKVIKETKVYSNEVNECLQNCITFFPIHLVPIKLDSWLDTIEKLNRIEKIPFDKIIEVVKKTREDDFWSKNFLSIPKLRKKNKEGLMNILVFNERINKNGKSNKQEINIQRINDKARAMFGESE
jgi:hypothetical protein